MNSRLSPVERRFFRFISVTAVAISLIGLLSGCSFANGGLRTQSYTPDALQLLESPFAKFLMQDSTDHAYATPEAQPEQPRGRSGIITALLYIPNRVFDLLDIVRLRLRVGPGIAGSLRATRPLSVFAGFYMSVYAGLPGPRQRPKLPWIIGFESRGGIAASIIDFAPDGRGGPQYSPTEFGAGLHLLIIGLDVGIDPVEIWDFAVGFLLFDPRKDDY